MLRTWRTSPPPTSTVVLNSLSESISSTVSTLATWQHAGCSLSLDALNDLMLRN